MSIGLFADVELFSVGRTNVSANPISLPRGCVPFIICFDKPKRLPDLAPKTTLILGLPLVHHAELWTHVISVGLSGTSQKINSLARPRQFQLEFRQFPASVLLDRNDLQIAFLFRSRDWNRQLRSHRISILYCTS